MIGLLALWLALFAVLVGWGLLALVVLRRLGGALSVFQTMWLGYAVLLAFLLLCSLALPVARGVLVMSLAPAIAGYVLQRHVVLRRLRSLWGGGNASNARHGCRRRHRVHLHRVRRL
jgi:hypothetical protein